MPLPFVKASTSNVRNRELSALGRFLYVVLGTYADLRTRKAEVTRGELAADIGKSVDTVDRLVRELAGAGLLSVLRVKDAAGVSQASVYTLLDADDVLRPAPQPGVDAGAAAADADPGEAADDAAEVAASVRLPHPPEEETAGPGGRTHAATWPHPCGTKRDTNT